MATGGMAIKLALQGRASDWLAARQSQRQTHRQQDRQTDSFPHLATILAKRSLRAWLECVISSVRWPGQLWYSTCKI